jgi:mannosyl-3-phosphoglycerate phosphatase
MRISAVFTDLDGTLLEPDGSACREAIETVAELGRAGVPVCPVTSKTAAELAVVMPALGLSSPAGFENGAGIRHPDGTVELLPAAVGSALLVRAFAQARRQTGAPARALGELSDAEVEALVGLGLDAIARARKRLATLPLVVGETWDDALRAALPATPALQLVRGNRFLHLQGMHRKADVLARLGELVGASGGTVVACGDAPNDVDLLAAAEIRIIVPAARGPHPVLVARFPDARVAPLPHGRGWAAALRAVSAGS